MSSDKKTLIKKGIRRLGYPEKKPYFLENNK